MAKDKTIKFTTRRVLGTHLESVLECEICGMMRVSVSEDSIPSIISKLQQSLSDSGCEHELTKSHQTKQG